MSNIVPLSQGSVYSGHQLALIRRTVAADCNNEEFDLFMAVAQSKELDPFTKQIHAIVYNKDKTDKRKMAIVTAIDGFRVIAERTGVYRPDDDEPVYEYDPELKGHLNPLGLVKVKVKVFKKDKPAIGIAFWDEFAPIKDEWAENDQGKWKPTGRQTFDSSGNWGKMPRHMLAKCAEAFALRKAFPEKLSGLYESAEFDRIRANEALPSELVAIAQTDDRLARIGAAGGIMFQLAPNEPLQQLGLGKIADAVIAAATDFGCVAHLDWFESVNRQSLREFWARSQTDALEVKKILEKRRAELAKSDAEVTA